MIMFIIFKPSPPLKKAHIAPHPRLVVRPLQFRGQGSLAHPSLLTFPVPPPTRKESAAAAMATVWPRPPYLRLRGFCCGGRGGQVEDEKVLVHHGGEGGGG